MDLKNLSIKPIINNRNKIDADLLVLGINKNNLKIEGKIYDCIEKMKENDEYKDKMISASQIFKCASGYFPLYYGFKWSFLSDDDKRKFYIYSSEESKNEFLNINENMKKQIIAFNPKTGKPVKGFENLYEAMEWLFSMSLNGQNPDYRSIISVATNNGDPKKPLTSYNFAWRFYENL